jgi:hypothetical protein
LQYTITTENLNINSLEGRFCLKLLFPKISKVVLVSGITFNRNKIQQRNFIPQPKQKHQYNTNLYFSILLIFIFFFLEGSVRELIESLGIYIFSIGWNTPVFILAND